MAKGYAGIRLSWPKSKRHRQNIRDATLRRYRDLAEHKKTSIAVKKGLPPDHSRGSKNPRFGKRMSEASKRKMRKTIAASGGRRGARNANFRHGRYVE